MLRSMNTTHNRGLNMHTASNDVHLSCAQPFFQQGPSLAEPTLT